MTTFVTCSDDDNIYSYDPNQNGGDPDCVISGNGGNDFLYGAWGNDYLYGGIGTDTLGGFGGNDHLFGQGGTDFLDGGAGSDVLNGGAGVDVADYFHSPSAVFINLLSHFANGGDATGDTLVSIEDVQGSPSGDSLTGDNGLNVLAGLAGGDYLDGKAGSDDLWGGDGNDLVFGGAGPDILYGGAGDDFIGGGPGGDQLSGGPGKDTFIFLAPGHSAVGNPDVIVGFRHDQHDVIDLGSIDANTIRPGDQAFVFIGANTFAHFHAQHPNVIGMIRFAGGIVQGNVNANLGPDFAIVVHGDAPHAADFVL